MILRCAAGHEIHSAVVGTVVTVERLQALPSSSGETTFLFLYREVCPDAPDCPDENRGAYYTQEADRPRRSTTLMTRLYFDTNIYRFIRATGDTAAVVRALTEHDCMLTASSGNLFETYAIQSHDDRKQELKVIVALADEYEHHPVSWLHALELRREIKRLRPKWLRVIVNNRAIRDIRDFLQAHRAEWEEAQEGIMPDPDSYAVYRRDYEGGVQRGRNFQKNLRRELPNPELRVTLTTPAVTALPVDMTNPEVYWRVESLQSWYNAIEHHSPASRDYDDWLGPYLRPGCFRDPTYHSCWLTEVRNEALPLNRLTGLVSFYQLQQKITHGNAEDRLHATHWFASDLFITADRAFHDVLTTTATNHYPNRPLPVLIDRSGNSVAAQLQ